MKKLLLALCAFVVPSLSFGAAYDVGIDQRPAANNVWERRLLVSPTTTGIMTYNPSTLLPVWVTLGQGLQVSGGVLSSTVQTGPAGPQGATGPQGPKGDTGSAGIKGDAGLTGLQGIQGVKGDAGAPGPAGVTGNQGAKGDQGIQGLTGPKGDTGSTGATGVSGPKGDIGLTGAVGAAGPAGPTGVKGDTGTTGAQGPVGPAGPIGPQGLTGLTGPQGSQGPKGDIGLTGPAGAKGDTGDTGAQGVSGAVGPQGPIGITGSTGPTGPAGASAPLPSGSVATRALNTAFQPSATRPVLVSYAVDISVTSLLLTGTQGTVSLQYADNSAMTTNLVTIDGGTNSTGGVLNVTNSATVKLIGLIPAGKFARIATSNTTGTPTFSYRAGNETVY